MSTTSDRDDPRLGHGTDSKPGPQNEAYLVMKDRNKLARPVRRSYRHVGVAGPANPVRDLTDDERECYAGAGYVKYEEYPDDGSRVLGRFWTQAELDKVGRGCQTVTTMARDIAETYAADPSFYGATFCVGCRMHLPVGRQGEFTWLTEDGRDTDERVGT